MFPLVKVGEVKLANDLEPAVPDELKSTPSCEAEPITLVLPYHNWYLEISACA